MRHKRVAASSVWNAAGFQPPSLELLERAALLRWCTSCNRTLFFGEAAAVPLVTWLLWQEPGATRTSIVKDIPLKVCSSCCCRTSRWCCVTCRPNSQAVSICCSALGCKHTLVNTQDCLLAVLPVQLMWECCKTGGCEAAGNQQATGAQQHVVHALVWNKDCT